MTWSSGLGLGRRDSRILGPGVGEEGVGVLRSGWRRGGSGQTSGVSGDVRDADFYPTDPREVLGPTVITVTAGRHTTAVASVCGGEAGGLSDLSSLNLAVAARTTNVLVRSSFYPTPA